MATTIATIEELARELSRALERTKRTSGEHEPGLDHYVRLKDGSPHWMTEVCHAAHGDTLPDDWRYEFIEDATDALAESGGDLDAAQEALDESDHYVYTSQLTGWLHSSNVRLGYVEDASEEFGGDLDTAQALGLGIRVEQRETLRRVYRALEDVCDA